MAQEQIKSLSKWIIKSLINNHLMKENHLLNSTSFTITSYRWKTNNFHHRIQILKFHRIFPLKQSFPLQARILCTFPKAISRAHLAPHDFPKNKPWVLGHSFW